MAGLKRRSVLAALAASGFLGITGTKTGAANSTKTVDRPSFTGGSGSDGGVVGVEVVDLETGDRDFYPSIDDVSHEERSDGRYEVIEVVAEDDEDDTTTISTQSETVNADMAEPTVEDGVDLRALVETATNYGYYAPDDTVTVWAGAVEREGGTDRAPAADVEIEVELRHSWQDTSLGSETVTTNDDGYAVVEFDLDGAEEGIYDAVLTSEETESTASDVFNIGTYTNLPFHWTGMTVGEETTLGVFSASGGTPQSDVTHEITADGPDDIEDSFEVSFDEGGIGLFDYTPEKPGDYRFQTSSSSRSVGAGELKALAPYFEIRDQYVDDGADTMQWGAHLVDDTEPVANEDVKIALRERWEDEVIDTATATTNEFGQFTVEIDKPNEPIDYELDIETEDGRSVFLFGDRIFFEELPSEAVPTRIDFNVNFDDFSLAPGETTMLEVELREEDEPIADQPVTILFSHTWNNVPFGSISVMTDEEGAFSQEFTVPENVPDGERVYAEAVTELDSETYTTDTSFGVERYDIDMDTWGLSRGETNAIDVSVTDQLTEDPVSDIDITVFGNRYNVDAETFDADHIRTDADGEGQLELTIPADVTNDVMVNELTPYRSTSISGGSIQSPFGADVEIVPEEPARGETFTVSYTTDLDEEVSALGVFPRRNGGDARIVREGEEVEFEVPEYIPAGSWEGVRLLMISEDGEVATFWGESFSIAEELTATFQFSPTAPGVGETVTFEDTSTTGPDAAIDIREWDLTDDGEVDETGEEVTFSYEEEGEYDVTLTVTDENGDTDTTTQTVSVEETEPEVADYTNDDGVVETDGLRDAVEDWRNGDIDTELLRDVVEAWRSGEQID